MIVDDSSIIRQMIENSLTSQNIEVVGTAADGKAAIELFKELRPEIVTLDITMPEIDGLTVLEELLKIDPDVKIMVITALSDKSTGIKAIKLGAKSFLGKPFTEEKLKKNFARLTGMSAK
ncbi:MAG: response regulator [Calditrichae bacterium]|nr:response regulator [Calditrichota bacterium]MCB9059620.1 response regulator [Calditrichia bacterium]